MIIAQPQNIGEIPMTEITPQTRINCVTHTDMDGIFSGLVVRHKYPQAIVFQTNYGRPIDRRWFDCDVLFVTDYTFENASKMKELFTEERPVLVWIDHHEAVDDAAKIGFNPEGLRRKDVSAAHLCWEYLFPGTDVPTVIKYISAYDTWNWENDVRALYFQNAIRTNNISINQKTGTDLFNALLSDTARLERLVAIGKKIEDYYTRRNTLVCKDSAFETSLDGIPAIACNIKTTNSLLFKPIEEKYKDVPLRILFAYFSSIHGYRVSVFSSDKDKYSSHVICSKYGGGGHAGAGGFQVAKLEDLPFQLPQRCKDLPEVTDIFHELKVMMDSDTAVENTAKCGGSCVVYGYSFGAVIDGYTACCVNDPTGHQSMFYQTSKDSLYQLGVFYNLMNNGWWRYRIYILDPSIDINDVTAAVPNSKIVDNSVIGFKPDPPVPVGVTNGSN